MVFLYPFMYFLYPFDILENFRSSHSTFSEMAQSLYQVLGMQNLKTWSVFSRTPHFSRRKHIYKLIKYKICHIKIHGLEIEYLSGYQIP